MSGYSTNIEKKTLENTNFREVLYTAPHSQLVVMTLQPGEDIGLERHEDGDQFKQVLAPIPTSTLSNELKRRHAGAQQVMRQSETICRTPSPPAGIG